MRRILPAALLLLLPAPVALGAGWGPPETVVRSSGLPIAPPAIVAAGPGFTVAWDDAEPVGAGTLRAADVLPGRRPAVRTLGGTTEDFGAGVASLASAGGRVFATWSYQCTPAGGCPYSMRVARWTPGQRTTQRLRPPGDGVGFTPRIGVTPAGEILMVWQRPGRAGLPGTTASWALLRDARWSRSGILFPDADPGGGRLEFAMAPGGTAVVGAGRLAATQQPGRAFDQGAVVFPEALGAIASATAAAVRRDGRAIVAAIGSPEAGSVVGTWRILVASQAADGTFRAPVTAAEFPALTVIGPPALATTTDGRAVVAWLRRLDGPRWTVMAAAETRPGGTWTRPRPLGPAARPVGRPAAVMDRDGGVTVAWAQTGRILTRTIGPGGRIGPARRASGDLDGCGTPVLATATDGRTAVAFACEGGRRIAVAVRPG